MELAKPIVFLGLGKYSQGSWTGDSFESGAILHFFAIASAKK
jgi:hypothetical protein